MRAVIRNEVKTPDAIGGEDSPAGKELEKLRRHFAQPVGKVPAFSVYKSDSVKKQLNALFHGKCAYCESFYASTAPVDVEHYRPKGAVYEDVNHPGYWWLAMDWDNLLPSCIDCNRKRKQKVANLSAQLVTLQAGQKGFSQSLLMSSGKKDSFPVLGTRAMAEGAAITDEYPLLLDPCRDDPQEHLKFHIDRENLISLVVPRPHPGAGLPVQAGTGADDATRSVIEQALEAGLSLKGALSIHVYGLNRLGLVQDRTRILRQLEFLEMLAIEIASLAEALEPNPDNPDGHTDRDKSIVQRMYLLQDHILQEMKRMASPEAPYSVMVQTWIEGFKARLLN
ncbi:TPA: endonuclease [Pseudomonas aeruginosa]|uniref:endonuclease n=1 Tax=Pseudomonas aeruginosa TaxID=287 RepID=UPI000B48C679|nr:endonuclease [Pseudomonas aeruginosa]ELK4826548.1 endonuclease [Pseudomonas aeruginosa]ELM5704366.1 endonuclease [Pseudomonas aeruginosa]MBG5230015.1 endonuclease [Pseudomonas aeruginosa]MBH3618982.1 endonuclease [Pseudomonas aeruginosa]MBM2717281.1 endonuclease [Pseudomonas aeruginosa]